MNRATSASLTSKFTVTFCTSSLSSNASINFRIFSPASSSTAIVFCGRQTIEALRRQRLLDEAATAYGKLRRDNKAWSEELAERKAWDKTLKDGLERA